MVSFSTTQRQLLTNYQLLLYFLRNLAGESQFLLFEFDRGFINLHLLTILTIDSALGVGIGQTLLLTHLVQSIPRIAPSISPEAVINAGAANLLSLTTDPQILYNLRLTWAGAVRVVFLFVVVASALSVLFSLGIERLNVHVVSQERKEIVSAERGQESATTQDVMCEKEKL